MCVCVRACVSESMYVYACISVCVYVAVCMCVDDSLLAQCRTRYEVAATSRMSKL